MELDFSQIILNALFILCTVAIGWIGWRIIKYLEALEEGAATVIGSQAYNQLIDYISTMVHAAWDKLGEDTGEDRLAWVVKQVTQYINALEPGLNRYFPFPIDFQDEDIEKLVRGVYDKILKELRSFNPGVEIEGE